MCLASKRDPKVSRPFGLFSNNWVYCATFGSLLQFVFHFLMCLAKEILKVNRLLGLFCNIWVSFATLGPFCNFWVSFASQWPFWVQVWHTKETQKGTSKETQQVRHQLVLVHVGNMVFGSLLQYLGLFCNIETLLGLICKTTETQQVYGKYVNN